MNATDFFSSSRYIFLPTRKNPKVALAVENANMTENAFKLYKPFSQKAKLLQKSSKIFFTSFNSLSKVILRTKREEKSGFVSYLENKLGKPLVSSVYFATVNDKVVLQLQTLDAQVIGYLKYPLNNIGIQHLLNEKRAIKVLSEKKIVKPFVLHDKYDSKPFLLLEPMEGEVGLVERKNIDELLDSFKREETYRLIDHPRIHELKNSMIDTVPQYLPLMENVCQKSTVQYTLVYEHGDFTPWNIINVEGRYVPFDFEHFVEDGLEYFDLIKYYYQIGKLLKGMKTEALIAFIFEHINLKEINELLQLFLIKEILRNKEENEPFAFEEKMLKMMEGK